MESYEQISFMDQSASTTLLKINVNQNLMVDLDSLKYNPAIRPLIKCLNHSPLIRVLTMFENVPVSHLSMVYSTSIYDSALDMINFMVHGHQTSITKVKFCNLLGLSSSNHGIHLDSVAISSIIVGFHQIGYNSGLSLISKLNKSALPPISNALFTILFKCLSKRVTDFDSASKLFYTLTFGLFTGRILIMEHLFGLNLLKV